MSSNCDEMRDQIADFITGILPEKEARALQQHLSDCSACKDYAQTLEKEEQLLTGFFAKFDATMTSREDEAISVINGFDTSGQASVIPAGKTILRSFLIRHAAVAVVIVLVALYFVITLSWISQINECIRLSL